MSHGFSRLRQHARRLPAVRERRQSEHGWAHQGTRHIHDNDYGSGEDNLVDPDTDADQIPDTDVDPEDYPSNLEPSPTLEDLPSLTFASLPTDTSTFNDFPDESSSVTAPVPTTTPSPPVVAHHTTSVEDTFPSSSSSSPLFNPVGTSTSSSVVAIPTSTLSPVSYSPTVTGSVADTTGISDPTSGAKKGPNGAAVAVPIVLVLFLLSGIAFFLIRRRLIAKRVARRNTWNDNFFAKAPQPEMSQAEQYATDPTQQPSRLSQVSVAAVSRLSRFSLKPSRLSQVTTGPASPQHAMPEGPVPSFLLSPPQPTYNNEQSLPLHSSPGSGIGPAGIVRAALVRCTFIPTLPDELSITTGAVVKVLAEFDDGWCLCENAQREQGMVPVECLEQGGNSSEFIVDGSNGFRNSKRISSLAGPMAR